MRVLLIDDEANVRQPLGMHLQDMGHDVRSAGSGEEGVWKLEERPADLVITDIKMPGISGLEVLRKVRDRWPGTEVVLITGFGTMEDALEALRLGAYDFLLKPVRLARLELLVNHCEERIRFSQDNRALREVVERLRELNQRKEKFTALANHEIRTPTTVASGLMSLLAERTADLPEDLCRLVAEGDRAMRRLKEVVEDLGDLGQALGDRLVLQPRQLTVADVVTELEDQGEMYAAVRALEIQVEPPPGGTDQPLRLDERKLRRAAGALLQNAVKFTPDGGAVRVQVGLDGDDLVIAVADTGVGVDADEAEKIFDLFYEVADVRHHRTSSHAFLGGGLGVGLPLARAIAQAHGGGVEYTANPEAAGSLFTLRVPRLHDPGS
jgi:signal transduction histidine kinase